MKAVLTIGVTTAALLLLFNLTLGDRQIDARIEAAYPVSDAQFLRTMGALLGRPITGGNRVQALRNGEEIFPAMLQAIRGARETVTFETYIYWSGSIGQAFADALMERARAVCGCTCCSTGGAPAISRSAISARWKRQVSKCTCTTRRASRRWLA